MYPYDYHPNSGWIIRHFQPTDFQAVKSVFLDCLSDIPGPRHPRRYYAQLTRALCSSTVLVAEEANAGIVGFMVVDETQSYVSHLFVTKNWRCCGIGGAFLTLGREMCGGQIFLDVDSENKPARAAYEAMGWNVAIPQSPRQRQQTIRLISPAG